MKLEDLKPDAAVGGILPDATATVVNAQWHGTNAITLTAWEVVHHLIRTLEGGGESATADLVRRLGGIADVARDLAYRLFAVAERAKRAQEAQSYNGASPELAGNLALGSFTKRRPNG